MAVAAFASQALAKPEPMPYKPVKAFISTRDIFGLDRRDTDAYSPYQSICGAAATCAQACGDAFDQCASSDNQMHCYNVQSNESCCPDGSGNSCDAGYYCSVDSTSQTWCCPEGMDLDTCASKYQVTGGLHTTSVALTTSTTSITSSTSATSTSVASSTTSLVVSSATTSVATHAASHVASHTASSSALAGGIFFDTGNGTAGAIPATGAYGASATSKISASVSDSAASGSASTTGSSAKSGASSSSPAAFLALFGAAVLVAFI